MQAPLETSPRSVFSLFFFFFVGRISPLSVVSETIEAALDSARFLKHRVSKKNLWELKKENDNYYEVTGGCHRRVLTRRKWTEKKVEK